MRLLLDTHIWIWSHLSPQLLVPRVAKELEDANNELFLSPISLWEVLMLSQKGRVVFRPDVHTWIENRFQEVHLADAPVTHEVARETSRIRLRQRAPADYFLAATARVFDLTLVTADRNLLSVPDLSLLPNR